MMDYEYYMKLCDQIATQSKCLSRKIGVLILTKDKSIVSSGYNGPVRKIAHCNEEERLNWLIENLKKNHFGDIKGYLLENGWGEKCPRQILNYKSGEGLEFCQAAHAERNAIVNAAREGIKIKDCIMLMNCGLPCQECAKEIVNSGIVKIVCLKKKNDYDIGARWIFQQSGIEVIEL